MEDLTSGDLAVATEALLSLTNHEVDRKWIEMALLRVIDGPFDLQLRQLAVICLGHVARIHGAISRDFVVPKLHLLERDPDLGSRARNALEDIEIFAGN